MTVAAVENLPVPNKQAIRQHLEFLFGDAGDYRDGKIEIAYSNPQTGSPDRADFFDTTEIEAAVDFIVDQNGRPGCNVYVGAALRSPDTPPMGRSSIEDYFASTALWADLDTLEAVDQAKIAYQALPPSLAVVTGRQPHKRAQFWWKLVDPETEAGDLRLALAGLCHALKGDNMVVDPARIMRVGGTIAWPHKKGRVVELTEVIIPASSSRCVSIEQVAGHYPPLQATGSGGLAAESEKPRNPITGTLQIQALLERTKETGQWWGNMRDAIASMVGRSWTDEQIRLAVQAFKWDSFTQAAHDKDINKLITTARKRFGRPEPDDTAPPANGASARAQTPDSTQGLDLQACDIADIDLNVPPREFLFGNLIGRKYVSMIIAPPGVGKSIFTMQLATTIAAGRQWNNWAVHQSDLRVWVYNNEEGYDELRRRLRAIMKSFSLRQEDLAGRLFVNSGEHREVIVARRDPRSDNVVWTPDAHRLIEEIRRLKIDVLIIDPFAETHAVNENSNDQIKEVARLYRTIAMQTDCAVVLVHHTRKGSDATGPATGGNADAARGGGAQIGVVRRLFTLAKMNPADAEKLGVTDTDRHWFVRFDDGKTNITAPAEKTEWFKFETVKIDNGSVVNREGDSVGVLVPADLGLTAASSQERHQEMLEMICQTMHGLRLFEITPARLAEYFLANGVTKYGDRYLRNAITSALENQRPQNVIISDGVGHKITITPSTGQRKARIIERREVKI